MEKDINMIIKNVVNMMQEELTEEQMHKLENVLYVVMFDPLFKVHTIVGIALNGFLKMTSTVCILFAAISTPPVVPDCVLLFYSVLQDDHVLS